MVDAAAYTWNANNISLATMITNVFIFVHPKNKDLKRIHFDSHFIVGNFENNFALAYFCDLQ